MEKISNGSSEIEWEQVKDQLSITLAPNQFGLIQMKTSEALFVQQGVLLAGKIQVLEEEKVVIKIRCCRVRVCGFIRRHHFFSPPTFAL